MNIHTIEVYSYFHTPLCKEWQTRHIYCSWLCPWIGLFIVTDLQDHLLSHQHDVLVSLLSRSLFFLPLTLSCSELPQESIGVSWGRGVATGEVNGMGICLSVHLFVPLDPEWAPP